MHVPLGPQESLNQDIIRYSAQQNVVAFDPGLSAQTPFLVTGSAAQSEPPFVQMDNEPWSPPKPPNDPAPRNPGDFLDGPVPGEGGIPGVKRRFGTGPLSPTPPTVPLPLPPPSPVEVDRAEWIAEGHRGQDCDLYVGGEWETGGYYPAFIDYARVQALVQNWLDANPDVKGKEAVGKFLAHFLDPTHFAAAAAVGWSHGGFAGALLDMAILAIIGLAGEAVESKAHHDREEAAREAWYAFLRAAKSKLCAHMSRNEHITQHADLCHEYFCSRARSGRRRLCLTGETVVIDCWPKPGSCTDDEGLLGDGPNGNGVPPPPGLPRSLFKGWCKYMLLWEGRCLCSN